MHLNVQKCVDMVYVCVRQPDVNIKCLPQEPATLLTEAESVAKPRAHHFGKTGQSACTENFLSQPLNLP